MHTQTANGSHTHTKKEKNRFPSQGLESDTIELGIVQSRVPRPLLLDFALQITIYIYIYIYRRLSRLSRLIALVGVRE